MLNQKIISILLSAEAKALATTGPQGLNVVPVSTIKIKNGQIFLVDYFFHKTRANLQSGDSVVLTAWSGLKGFQIKATVEYLTEGQIFDETVAWIAKLHPDRTVHGTVILTPTNVYDIGIG